MTSHSFAPRWIQRTARLCLVSFTWTFVLATPTHLLANPIPKTFAPARPFAVPASAIKHKLIPPPASLKHNLKPLAPAQLARLQARASAHPHPSATLLDEVGRLNGTVLDSQVSAWRQRLAKPGQSPTAQAKLRLAIGEAELAKYEQPEQAIAQFDQTRRLAGPRSPLAGQARYDSAVALFYEGAYRPAEEAFGALLRDPHPAPGLDRRQAARWLRHATACAGYHARRERAGIREPQRLDPLCGAEAIAVALRAMKRPYDRSTVLANVRVTGEGSNMQDLVNAGRKLGLAPHVVAAGDKGLKLLPMPLVAAVEHDHFVAIYKVNAQGVTYLCSDCGAWPGGERTVTWKQWRLMEAGPFLTLSLPGSVEDRALARLEAKRGAQDRQAAVIDGRGNDVNVFARGPSAECPSGAQAGRSAAHDRYSGAPGAHVALAGYQGLSDVAQVARLAESLKAAAVRQYAAPAVLTTCGAKPTGQACCPQPCPTDGGPTTSGPIGQPKTLADGGPSKGDPVNLATGEEEYQPDADLTVYNPIGPSVSISRIYNSLRPMDQTYESDDFGVGWSHPYNITVYDPTVNVNYRLQQGGSTSVTATGTDLPGSGLTWDIVLNGSTVASSSSAGSWSVSNSFGSTSISISVPSGATIATSYEVRYSNHGFGSGKSAKFDVVSSSSVPQVPQGASAMAISGSGSDSPGTGLTWDVVQSTTTIASSSAPNGWAASYPGYITCPNLATPGSYELRTHFSGHGIVSFNFQVYAVNYIPKTGTRYLIEPNGARVPITASSVPTSGSPTVVCTVAAGYPYYVEWKYSSGNTSGYYVITGADRTKMTTTTAAKAIGWTTGGGGVPITTTTSAILMVVSQITDNNGNSINLLYGGSGPSGFPLLTSITDSGSSALITITHDSTTGGITEIDDRYSRSVYYSVGSYATTNVPGGYPQYFMEVDHVSQIVATGTSSPPDRYAYGYQSVSNGEGSEEVPFLHTITVPSPTGTGTATATINYATDGTCVVTSIVDANGNQAVYTPVTSVASTQVTYKDSGGTTIYQYTADFDSNMSEVQRTNGSGVYQATNTFSDPNDPYRPSNITNAVSVSTDYTWDQFGNTLTRTSARGTVTTFTVDYTNFPLGELTQIVEGSKTATSLIYYEPSGLIHTLVTPKPGTAGSSQTVTSTWTYDSLGNVLTETGPGNSSTVTSITNTFNYTTDGTYSQSAAIRQPLTKTDNLGHVTHMRYDARANLTGVLDAVGNETDLSYNLANQNTTITFAATGSTGTGHATFNNVYLYAGGPKTEETQKNESATQVFDIVYTLGAEGEELGRSGSTQPYTATLDALYRPVSVSDGNSHATQMYYNSAGYAWKTVYPNGDTFEYTSFNDIGQPTQRVDGRSVTTNYTYSDAESKLSAVAYPACTSINVSLHYDSYGRMDTMSDGSGSHAYSYDDRDGRLTDQTTYTGLSAMTLTTAYNDDGSRASLILPDTTSFSYSYDAAARLTGLVNPSGQTWGWIYLDNNWLSEQDVNGQIITLPTRDARGFVTDLLNERNNMAHTQLSEYAISYASNMTIGSVTASMPAAPSSYSGTTSYTHDTKLQLTNETSTRAGGYNLSSAFDSAGNATTYKGASNSYNSSNQNTAWTFDGNGNPTSYGGATLTFDAENRMTAYGSAMTAGYRADGLRAWKTNSAGTTYYLYDGANPVEELDGSGTKSAVMTFGPNGPLARTDASRTLLYTFDALGQMAQQIDASTGNIIASYLFDAWGARSVSTSDPTAGSDPYSGYNAAAGYVTDWETGLQLLGHRYYDPAMGRFLNRDPIGMAGGINIYEYCGNTPLHGADPSGYFWGIPAAALLCVISVLKEMATVPACGGWRPWVTLICQIVANCIIPLLGSIIPGPLGCVIGAIVGALSNVISNLCQKIPCNGKADWEVDPGCYVAEIITAAITGCLGGFGTVLFTGGAYLAQLAGILAMPICQFVKFWMT